jgi:hypothetical protein
MSHQVSAFLQCVLMSSCSWDGCLEATADALAGPNRRGEKRCRTAGLGPADLLADNGINRSLAAAVTCRYMVLLALVLGGADVGGGQLHFLTAALL